MGARYKKVAMIMLVCLIGVAPLIQVYHAFASPESEAAKVDNNKAAAMLQDMMKKMDAMSKTPMSANEKQMMQMLRQMADMIKMLIDANKNLIAAVEHGTK
jgi:hypothetical protein